MPDPFDPVIGALQVCTPSPQSPLVVAFSGGLDSTVLLHAAVHRWGSACVVAAHVDHQLQSASARWLAHCREQAQALNVRFEGCSLASHGSPPRAPELRRMADAGPHQTTNLEAWARQARYEALTRIARACHAVALVTAHHADDQLETVLMALARGAGLDGLTGIAAQTQRGGVALIRPFLELPRSALHLWAQQQQLQWIEDPMNVWPHLRRTAIRQQLTPVLDEVLPGLRRQLPVALASLRESREALDESTWLELAALEVAPRGLQALDRDALAALPEARQRRLLRGWLAALGLAMPTRARLQAMRAQCLEAASAHAHLRHEGWHLVRQGRRLLAWPDENHPRWVAPSEPIALEGWSDEGLALPDGSWLRASGEGARAGGAQARGAQAGSEQGGRNGVCPNWLRSASFSLIRPGATMRVRLREQGPSREVRKLWQEAGVPVSVRGSCALILANGRPFWLMPFGQLAGPWPMVQDGLVLHWQTRIGDPRAIEG